MVRPRSYRLFITSTLLHLGKDINSLVVSLAYLCPCMEESTSLHGGVNVCCCSWLVAVICFGLFLALVLNFIWWWIVMLSSVFLYGSQGACPFFWSICI